jgi:hypothetical protein
MSDISVDTEELTTAAETVRQSADKADEVAEYARDADPDLWIWGIPGTLLAAPYYFMIAEILHGQLEGVRATIEGYADKVKECAEAYRAADAQTVSDLEAIGGEMEGS